MIVHFRTPTFPLFFRPTNVEKRGIKVRTWASLRIGQPSASVGWAQWHAEDSQEHVAPHPQEIRCAMVRQRLGGDTRLGRFLEIFRHRWHRSSKHNTCVIVPFQILCLSWRSFESRHFAAPNPLVQTHGDGVQLIGNPTKSPKTVMVFKSWPHEWGVWYFPILMIYEYFWLMTYHSCDDSEF